MRDLPRKKDKAPLTGADYNRLAEQINKIGTIKVGGNLDYRRTPGGHAIFGKPSWNEPRRQIWAIITGQIPLTIRDVYNRTHQRWIYEWYEVYRKQTGAAVSWERLPGGLGTDEEGGEMPGAQNAADWAWIGDPTAEKDFYISPVPVGTVVPLSIIETVDGWTECWFESPTNQDTQAPSTAVETTTFYANDGKSWNIYWGEGNVDKGQCLKVRIVEYVNYNDQDYKCTAYCRWLTFDPTGRLVAISGTEEETVFLAVECP